MKFRHLFATLSLAIVAGAGVAAGLSSGSAQKAEATGTKKTFFVYVEDKVTDYHNSGNSYDWLAGTSDAISANAYNSSNGSAATESGGTIMKRVSQDVVGISFIDNVSVDALELYNCWTDNKEIRNRSTYKDTGTPIVFDISQHNTFSLVKYNCPDGIYCGSFDMDYGWSIVIKSGTDSGVNLEYDFGENQFEYSGLSLTAGTTFTIEDTLSNTVTVGKTGEGSAFSDGSISVSKGVYTVNKTGIYDMYANTNGNEVWMENNAGESAKAFAASFVSSVEGNCPYNYSQGKASGKAVSDLVDAWNDQGTAYGHLTTGTKSVLHDATTADADASLASFARVYDYVLGRYESTLTQSGNAGNFANRTVVPVAGAINPITTSVESSYTSIIAIIGVVSLVAIGGFFFIRRKRA